MKKTLFISFIFSILFSLPATAYECDGRKRCSQMTSCEDAMRVLKNCTGTEMDGDNDGVPCEQQWCNGVEPQAQGVFNNRQDKVVLSLPADPVSKSTISPVEDAISKAFRDRSKDIQVIGSGTVTKVLSDDNEGGRHQRFIVKTDSGVSVLVAHNIDLAPRIDELRGGEKVTFYGEYVWNDKGGVIHWTHHDPAGVHKAGWIKYRGNKYQ